MPYMYILECSDGSYYTGSTWDLQRRLWEHQNGLGANHTAKHLPVALVYCEECERVEDAYAREKQIQGWSRKKKQALMAGDTNLLHQLAGCRNASHSSNIGFGSAQPTGYVQPKGYVETTGSVQPKGYVETTGYAQPKGYVETTGYVQPKGYIETTGSAQPTGYVETTGSAQPTSSVQVTSSAQPMGFDQATSSDQPKGSDQSTGSAQAADSGQSTARSLSGVEGNLMKTDEQQ